jgi:hypothetical protein
LNFTDGYAIQKFRNVDVNGKQGSDKTGDFSDADFPIFRLADAYLMYAECAVEVQVELLLPQLVCLRTRANGSVTQGDLNLNFILDERARITLGRTQKRFGSFW